MPNGTTAPTAFVRIHPWFGDILGAHMPTDYHAELIEALPTWANVSVDTLSPLPRSAITAALSPSSMTSSPCPAPLLVTRGNILAAVMVNGPRIYQRISDRLATAQHAIYAAFYNWEPDSRCATLFGDGIRRAASATTTPLHIRLMVSDNTLPLTGRSINNLWDSVKQWGITQPHVRFELATYPYQYRGSMHDKLVVVDCKTIVVTGANPQVVHDDPETCWIDSGYTIEGPLALAGAAAFDDAWHNHAKHWTCHDRRGYDCRGTRHPHSARPWVRRSLFSDNEPDGGCVMAALGKSAGSTLDNPQVQGWLSLLSNAQQSVNIVSPNLDAPGFIEALAQAAARGVKVRLLSSKGFNDFLIDLSGHTNEEIINSLYGRLSQLPSWAVMNVEVKWHSVNGDIAIDGNGECACHTKWFCADNEVTVVGSGNMDEQSWKFSREFNVLIVGARESGVIARRTFAPYWRSGVRT